MLKKYVWILVDPAVREHSDHSLTSHYYGLRTIKKHLKHSNYDSVVKFGIEGVGINTNFIFQR